MTRFIALIVPVALVLAGCASDDSGDDSNNSTGATSGTSTSGTSTAGASAGGASASSGQGTATTASGGSQSTDTSTVAGGTGSGGTSSGSTTVGNDCGGWLGLTCSDSEFCLYSVDASCGSGDQMGTCTSIPEACPSIQAPVCGCDDTPYSNECSAWREGVSVASDGEC